MWSLVLRIGSYVLSGIGIGELLDKFVKPKVPAQYYPQPVSPGFTAFKVVTLIILITAGAMVVKFIGRKTNVKILK
jgi:hypothetical protein